MTMAVPSKVAQSDPIKSPRQSRLLKYHQEFRPMTNRPRMTTRVVRLAERWRSVSTLASSPDTSLRSLAINQKGNQNISHDHSITWQHVDQHTRKRCAIELDHSTPRATSLTFDNGSNSGIGSLETLSLLSVPRNWHISSRRILREQDIKLSQLTRFSNSPSPAPLSVSLILGQGSVPPWNIVNTLWTWTVFQPYTQWVCGD